MTRASIFVLTLVGVILSSHPVAFGQANHEVWCPDPKADIDSYRYL